ncbi:hypothetical protein DPX16_23386 [Anabarilius grahami]|uniref:Uncharacterized protein n=1 Tax=Anabarilius grahami TaxID=495550 RepID=A0A3N0Y1E5_ANAGA|nr:hypothetical protein DPX16_23386 [Anabarilius grahami]
MDLKLLLPESRPYLEYLAWMLRNGGLFPSASEPEVLTEVITEPEHIKAPELTQTAPWIRWHHWYHQAPRLCPSRSLRAAHLPHLGLHLHQLGLSSTSGLRAHVSTSTCQPVTIASAHRLHSPSVRMLRWAHSPLQVGLRRSTPSFRYGLPGFQLRLNPEPLQRHRAPPFLQTPSCSLAPLSSRSSEIPVVASVPLASSSGPGFQACDVTQVRQPQCSAGASTNHGSASADRSQGSVRPCSQDSTLDPPTINSTMLLQAPVRHQLHALRRRLHPFSSL